MFPFMAYANECVCGGELKHSLLSRSLSQEPVGTYRCMPSSLLPFQLLLIQGTPSLVHATWALSPEELAYASRASPGLWVDCLLKMHAKETLPSAGIWSTATGCRGSSIRTDYVVFVCHFCLMVNKIYFWLRILASWPVGEYWLTSFTSHVEKTCALGNQLELSLILMFSSQWN